MSYAIQGEYPLSASAAPATERAAFIRNTYAHLAGAVAAFIGIEAILLLTPGLEPLVMGFIGISQHAWLLIILAFMGASYAANSFAMQNTSRPLQYVGLGIYIVAEAVIFLPLLYIAKMFYPDAIRDAGIMTAMMFVGLSACVLISGKDFSFMRTGLVVGGFLALGLVGASLLFGFALGMAFCFFMVALACGYIIYDTSNVLHHYRTDQYVAAALALFASVALLFYYVLRLLMMISRR